MANVVQEAVKDIALLIFDRALEFAGERLLGKVIGTPISVTRDDIIAAVISLRFDLMNVTVAQIDLMREIHAVHLAAIKARHERERQLGDVPDVTIVDDPDPQFRMVFSDHVKDKKP